jgi:hypothetical protein
VTADAGDAADELYGLPAPEFTAARDRMAAGVRQAGDRDLAAAVKKLRRPTVSAWFANQLVRRYGDQVADLLDTGAALRRAQAGLDVDELRRQNQVGQHMVTELARKARQIAADTGQSLSDDNVRELEETLHAGLIDPAASDAIRAGRLTTPLRYSGFGLLDAAEPDGPPAPPAPPTRVEPRHRHGPEDEAARQAVKDAEAEVGAARRQAGEQARRAGQARKHRDLLRERIRRLEEELEQLRTEESGASDAVVAAARALRSAEDRVAQAEDALDRVREAP